MTRRPLLAVIAVAVVSALGVACSSSDSDDQEYNRITRIDGPATVDDDAGADQDGAPLDAPDPLVRDGSEITPGS